MKNANNASISTTIATVIVSTVFMYGWMRLILKDIPEYITDKGLINVAKEKYDSFMKKEA
nr:MAG TPA: hypothetical protein [Caudoviricetes sp.]